MRYSALLCSLLFSACGQAQGSYPAEFSPYLEAFKGQAAKHGRLIPSDYLNSLDMSFGDPTESCGTEAVACCTVYENGFRQVIVDQKVYDDLSLTLRFELFFHELGHCLLNQMKHRDAKDDLGRPTSVMHAALFPGDFFQSRMSEYMDELFDFQ